MPAAGSTTSSYASGESCPSTFPVSRRSVTAPGPAFAATFGKNGRRDVGGERGLGLQLRRRP